MSVRTTFHPQISLEELASAVSSESVVWVRVAACERIPGPWRLRILEVVAGQSPSGWSSKRWTYPATDLISEAFSGKTVADWLREGRVLLPNRDMGSEQFSSVLQLERQQSYAQTGFQVFDWPTYEVQLTHLQSNEPPRPLISADGSPSFASFFNAASSFFGMGPQTVGGSIPSAAVFRWIDKRARINRVDIAEDELRVEVEGDLLDGLLIELAGDDPGTSQRLPSGTGVRKVTFPLQEGLPPGAWVLVEPTPNGSIADSCRGRGHVDRSAASILSWTQRRDSMRTSPPATTIPSSSSVRSPAATTRKPAR